VDLSDDPREPDYTDTYDYESDSDLEDSPSSPSTSSCQAQLPSSSPSEIPRMINEPIKESASSLDYLQESLDPDSCSQGDSLLACVPPDPSEKVDTQPIDVLGFAFNLTFLSHLTSGPQG
jgi:hypothetical protein